MRVVAGKYRAKKLKEFDIDTTRPTLDRVKEAIFSSIQFDLPNAVVLDLFAGTGALGIEAISRGAKMTYFVDSNQDAIKIIKENLKNITESYKVERTEYLQFLKNNNDKKFDVILLDPPFKTDYGEKAIQYILDNNMLADGGVIVYEKSKDTKIDFDNTKTKTYGTVEVCFIRKRDE